MIIESWGRTKQSESMVFKSINDGLKREPKMLVAGSMLSYGDSCLNSGKGVYFNSTNDLILKFNQVLGTIKVQSGISFDSLLKFIVPRGCFLPVTPGTKFITVGGAVANDIHGKNHHLDGNFGHWIEELTLVRSDATYICSEKENPDLFHATIGGLGLTGYIQDCTFRLQKIQSAFIDSEIIKFNSIKDFFRINQESQSFKYTVSWIDCARSQGLYIRGNHSERGGLVPHKDPGMKTIPVNFPTWALNKLSVGAFNLLYFNKQFTKEKKSLVHYDPFFYPLDSIKSWNKVYGKNGLFQFQCVIPHENAGLHLDRLLKLIKRSGQGSFLSVLKTFGPIPSKGLLSFPQEGITLALDFPNKGAATTKLLENLYQVVNEANGRIYPAKDQILERDQFETMYPKFKEFEKYIDPRFSSDWWERVRG